VKNASIIISNINIEENVHSYTIKGVLDYILCCQTRLLSTLSRRGTAKNELARPRATAKHDREKLKKRPLLCEAESGR